MNNCRVPSTNTIGFCLLPSELIERILLRLALPEIIRFKLVSKTVSEIVCNRDFVRQCNSQWRPATWLFVYKKRRRCDSVLDGFSDRSDRWFRFSISDLLKPAIFPGEDLFFLTASGNLFLFASNTLQSVITLDLVTNTVKKIPPSPLGRRGTCSWRRSGMKLVPNKNGSGHFRFVFAELVETRPVVFEYDSETDTWRSTEATDDPTPERESLAFTRDHVFLTLINRGRESVVISVNSRDEAPAILRPRFSWGNGIDRLHVYGDGFMMVVRSDGAGEGKRIVVGIEMWGLGTRGTRWEFVSELPGDLLGRAKKPYRVMTGCLEGNNGTIKGVLMSNYEGLWDIIWVSFDFETREWKWVPLPECKMKGLNMAGIAFSSALTMP